MSILDLFLDANAATDNLFGGMSLFSLYVSIAIYIIFNRDDYISAFITAGTITAFSSIFLRIVGVIDDRTLYICFALCVIPIIISLFLNKQSG